MYLNDAVLIASKIYFKVKFQAFQKSHIIFQNSLKLLKRNEAVLFDSILMLGFKKLTSEFSSLTGQKMHINKKVAF